MKRFAATAAALVMVFALAGQVSAQSISGSGHDFTAAGWNTASELCNVCHVPHNAANYTKGPLWNHEISGEVFGTYTNTTTQTLDGTAVEPGDPSASRLCLSCHDGSVALDDFGGTTTGTNFIAGGFDLSPSGTGGVDASDDHPIGILYAADTDLNAVTSTMGTKTIEDYLVGGTTLECSTCHNVHDDTNTSMLRVSNAGSALCLVCHNK